MRRTGMGRARPASAQRHEVITTTHARSMFICEMHALVPTVTCGGRLDCHEVKARGTTPGSHLDASVTMTTCRRHHDWVDAHIPEAEALGVRLRSSYERDGGPRRLR